MENHAKASLEFPVHVNEVFVNWTKESFDHLDSQDIQFGLWPGRDDLARFVFGHSTSEVDVMVLIKAIEDSLD